jgi:hypothetical protein
MKPIIQDIFIKGEPYGNGEDIFMSFMIMYLNGYLNYAMYVDVIELPNEKAICQGKEHYQYRNELCKEIYKRRYIIEYAMDS